MFFRQMFLVSIALIIPSLLYAYTFDVQVGTLVLTAQTTGTPTHWPSLPIPLTPALDGGAFDAAVVDAAQTWDTVAPTFTLSASAPTLVRWAAPGEIPPKIAAWTVKQVHAGDIVCATVLLDPTKCWGVYSGPLTSTLCDGRWEILQEVRRVALHELGHVIGLSHPDQGGQRVAAIMNSVESDLEQLTSDDRAGRIALEQPERLPVPGHSGGCTLTPDPGPVEVGILAVWMGIMGLQRACRYVQRRGGSL